jgi:hypothetical protein
MSVRIVLGAGFALLLALLVFSLAQSEPRSAGSNHVREVAEVAELRGDGRRCQEGETVPEDAGRLLLLIGTYGRPAPELRVMATAPGGERVTAGRRPSGGSEGRVEIPVEPVSETEPGSRVCISVAGPGRTVLYGDGQSLRLEWLHEEDQSWFALLPSIAERFALGKWNPFGVLLLPLVGLVLLLTWAATVRLVLREVGDEPA